MRSVRIATWTSGEPVSFGLVACSLMSAFLRSAVIDIVMSFGSGVDLAGQAGMSSSKVRSPHPPHRGRDAQPAIGPVARAYTRNPRKR
jgi:hypothetical protein